MLFRNQLPGENHHLIIKGSRMKEETIKLIKKCQSEETLELIHRFAKKLIEI